MSFSSKVKEELMEHVSKARHCQVAELSAILGTAGHIRLEETILEVQSESLPVIQKIFVLLQKAFNIKADIAFRRGQKGSRVRQYVLWLHDRTAVYRVLTEVGFLRKKDRQVVSNITPEKLLQRSCCRKAYIRGAFLAGGSISDPQKHYHVEVISEDAAHAELLQKMLQSFEIESRIIERVRPSKRVVYVLYLKNGEQIIDVLSATGAHQALFALENIRVFKHVRNKVNRQVNCETANLNKTINASVKQVKDIRYLIDTGAFAKLPPELKEMAQVRLDHEDLPLKDLGPLLEPPVSKSGVNHRLKRLSQIAEELRQDNG